MATGNLRITTNATVTRVLTGADGKATGVEYFDKAGKAQVARARVVVMAASACDTAKILLNSHTSKASKGLGQFQRRGGAQPARHHRHQCARTYSGPGRPPALQ